MLSHPLPQLRRDLWLPLDIGPAGTGELDRWTQRCRFRVPDEWKERTLLQVGGADWEARVLLDGREVCVHRGGYARFGVDCGNLVAGSEHELVIDSFDPLDDVFGQAKGKQRGSHDIWYTRTVGAWQPVWIEAVPDDYIRDPQPLLDAVEIDNPRLWSPSDPWLYDVELRHGDDVIHSYVGYRTIEARGRELYLNGEKLRLAGVLDQGFWPDTIYAADATRLQRDVEAAKEAGFNLARKHVKVEDARWYALCDRLGLLVAQDMPSSHSLVREEARAQFMDEWLEVIAQLRHHPSVIVWIPINEDWGEPPPTFQQELVRATRAADPTRLVIDASGWKQLDDTDLVDAHDYGATLTKHAEKRRDDIPLWIGELGGLSLAGSAGGQAADARPERATDEFVYRRVDDLATSYRALIEQIPDDVAGFCWTQLTDVEQEQNGLLTADRQWKTDPAAVRAVNEAFLDA